MVLVMLARWMRRRRLGGLSIALLVLAGCAPGPSDGGLWDRQGGRQGGVVGNLSTAQRSAAAHATELGLVDAQLASEDTRLSTALDMCPGAERAGLQASPADPLRDSMRIRASADAQRLAHVSNQALADWYLRRARQTGKADQCTKARAALSGQVSPTPNPPTPNPAAPNPAASNPAAPNSAAQ